MIWLIEVCRFRHIVKGAVAAIVQKEFPPLGLGRGHEHVKQAVAVEVVDDACAGHRLEPRVEPDAGNDD